MIGKQSKVFKDILWYLAGFIIPTLLGFIKNPIFTRYFTPNEYGYFSIVNTTFSFVTIVVYSWINSCMYRFYNHYKYKNSLNVFFSNIAFLYLISSGIAALVCIIWTSFYGNSLIRTLIILNGLETIVSQILCIYLITIRLEGKALRYNVMNVCTAFFSFLILLILAFSLNYRIDAMIGSRLLVDLGLLIYIAVLSYKKIKISIANISREIIKKLISYGFPAALCNICLLVLTSSDRYIISTFYSMDSVGIYNQIYNISEISIAAFITIYANSINPILLRELETNFDNYGVTLTKYTTLYIYLILPFTLYFSLFSRQISILLLGEKFRSGYIMMPYVMITAFIYGITGLVQDVFRFGNKLNVLIKGFAIASVTNIILNFIFVPTLGYQLAAVTTFASYVVLYFYYYHFLSSKYFNSLSNLKDIFPAVLILAIEALSDIFIRAALKLDLGVMATILEGLVFLVLYVIFIRRKLTHFLKHDDFHMKEAAA